MRTRIGGWWSCAAFCVVLFGSAGEAAACQPPPEGWFPSGTFPTPANGVMLLSYGCYTNCETPPNAGSLLIRNARGDVVPGTVVFTQFRDTAVILAFRPEPGALTAGASYTAELEGVPSIGGILVGPALTWNDALTLTEAIFEVDHPVGEPECCTGPLDSCGNTPCFSKEVDRRTTVTVGFYDSDVASEHYQYVFRRGEDVIDPDTPWSWDNGDVRFELDATQGSACYVLEVKRLVDDSVQAFAPRCIERPATFTPGVHPARDEDVAAVLQACDEPPDGYEEIWCEERTLLCETSPDDPSCVELADRCAMSGAAGAAGAASAGGSGGETAGSGNAAGSGGTAGAVQGTGGGAGSSGARPGSGGQATGGTTSIPAGAGGMAEAGASDGQAGEAGAAGQGRVVYTKGCGCSVPGSGQRGPALLAFATVALAACARRLRRGP